jgi:hypothetical protein
MSYALLPSGDLHLTFEDNSSMFISAYADGVARVRWYPRGAPHPHMQRTWSFVDRDGACPPEGWQRDALSAVIADRFPQLALSVTEHDGHLHLTLGEITITARAIASVPRLADRRTRCVQRQRADRLRA